MAPMDPTVKQAIAAASRRSAREAVRETLLTLGIDASTPAEIREVQADFAFLRRLRTVTGIRNTKFSIIVFSTLMTLLGGVVGSWLQKVTGW